MRRDLAAPVLVACVAALAFATLAVAQQHPGAGQGQQSQAPHARPPRDAGAPAAPVDGGLDAEVPPAVPDGGTPNGGDVDRLDDGDDWRVPPDLVDPFPELHGTRPGAPPDTDADDQVRLHPLRPRSWYLIEEDLVDPWNPGHRRAYRVASCDDVPCGPIVESASQLGAPTRVPRRGDPASRMRTTEAVDVSLLAGAGTLGEGDARARLEAQIALREGTFLIGLGLTISGGTAHGLAAGDSGLYERRTGYGRHGAVLVLAHRLTDGVLKLDVALEVGAILSAMNATDVLPLVRLAATGGLGVARGVAIVARLDAGTTFVAPSGFVIGPSAFDVGIFLGVRLGDE